MYLNRAIKVQGSTEQQPPPQVSRNLLVCHIRCDGHIIYIWWKNRLNVKFPIVASVSNPCIIGEQINKKYIINTLYYWLRTCSMCLFLFLGGIRLYPPFPLPQTSTFYYYLYAQRRTYYYYYYCKTQEYFLENNCVFIVRVYPWKIIK